MSKKSISIVMSDFEKFRVSGDEFHFRAVVEEYSGLVYGVALRKTRDQEMAKEVSQNVFLSLVKNAGGIRDVRALPGWLHRAAMNESRALIRSEVRYRERMEHFRTQKMNQKTVNDAGLFGVRDFLDEVIGKLSRGDRELLFRHYYDGKTFAEIGAEIGITEAACQKRASRIIEKLRGRFVKHGVAISSAAVMSNLTAELKHRLPVGFAEELSLRVLAGDLARQGSSQDLASGMKMVMDFVKKAPVMVGLGIGLVVVAVLVGPAAESSAREKLSSSIEGKPIGEEVRSIREIAIIDHHSDDPTDNEVHSLDPYKKAREEFVEALKENQPVKNLEKKIVQEDPNISRLGEPGGGIFPPENDPNTGELHLKVVDAGTGEELSDFYVTLSWKLEVDFSFGDFPEISGERENERYQGRRGGIVFKGLSDIPWGIEVASDGYLKCDARFRLKEGKKNLTLLMTKIGGTLSGRIVEKTTREGVRGAVRLKIELDQDDQRVHELMVYSGPNGYFEFAGVPKGRHRATLSVIDNRYFPFSRDVDLSGGGRQNLGEVRVERHFEFNGRVVGENGKGLRGQAVYLMPLEMNHLNKDAVAKEYEGGVGRLEMNIEKINRVRREEEASDPVDELSLYLERLDWGFHKLENDRGGNVWRFLANQEGDFGASVDRFVQAEKMRIPAGTYRVVYGDPSRDSQVIEIGHGMARKFVLTSSR